MPDQTEAIYDQWLVLRTQDGDREALARLVARWQDRLVRHAHRLLGHEDDAHDVVQEVWVGVARSIRRLEDPATFRAWIYRIVTNKSADRVRKLQRDRRTLEGHAELERVSSRAESSCDAVDIVQDAIAQMPIEQQVLLRLHYLDELGVRELSIVFDIPPGTVKSRLFTARKQLARIIERNKQ
ncbi:MAG: RNA polymerase sigma factor [Planctomycetota bacterium]|jgi:RNA polymerase sigma-70 factor (ECF subfamily)